MRFTGMICYHPRTNQLDFGSNQVKGQGPGHEKLKNIFCHNTLSFRLIHVNSTSKCSLFYSLSMVTNVVLAKVCTLPSGLYVCMYCTNIPISYHAKITCIFVRVIFILAYN